MQVASGTRYILYLFLLVLVAGLVALTYVQTKSSYLAVGTNNGAINARSEIMDSIRDLYGKIKICSGLDEEIEKIEFLRVKADFLYVIKSGENKVEFCKS